MHLSLVIPLLNEEGSLQELYDWIVNVLRQESWAYEILFIDDGSTDKSWSIIETLSTQDPKVKGLRFLKNYGKSQALHAGFKLANGEVVITMDADLQDSPEEIPALYRLIAEDQYELVSGWKKKRYDAFLAKNLPSKLFNWAARRTSGLPLHDFNCGLKAYQNKVVKNIEVSGEMHRYIPVLAKNAGFSKISEKIVQHQARKYGTTKFGMERFLNGFLDLVTIWFVSKFGRRPMHLFGALGVLMFVIGFGFSVYLGIDKLYLNPTSRLITDRPPFYIALTCMVIGSQLFVAGFLGELFIRTKQKGAPYKVQETLNIQD
ncbi:MAG: glycosyltransferase family 2 protein [Bacteroidota bacterium]